MPPVFKTYSEAVGVFQWWVVAFMLPEEPEVVLNPSFLQNDRHNQRRPELFSTSVKAGQRVIYSMFSIVSDFRYST